MNATQVRDLQLTDRNKGPRAPPLTDKYCRTASMGDTSLFVFLKYTKLLCLKRSIFDCLTLNCTKEGKFLSSTATSLKERCTVGSYVG